MSKLALYPNPLFLAAYYHVLTSGIAPSVHKVGVQADQLDILIG